MNRAVLQCCTYIQYYASMREDTRQADEFYAERVSIMLFDGGLSLQEAEYRAAVATYRWCWRTGNDWPKARSFASVADGLSRDLVEILSTEEADTRYHYGNLT